MPNQRDETEGEPESCIEEHAARAVATASGRGLMVREANERVRGRPATRRARSAGTCRTAPRTACGSPRRAARRGRAGALAARSEERRVGKECRYRWWP